MKESDNFKAVLKGKTLTITPGTQYRIGDHEHPVTDPGYVERSGDKYYLAHQLLMCCMDGLALGANRIICGYGSSKRGKLHNDDYSVWQRAGDEAGFTWDRYTQELCPLHSPEDNQIPRMVIARVQSVHRTGLAKVLEEVPIEVVDAVPGVGADVHGGGDAAAW